MATQTAAEKKAAAQEKAAAEANAEQTQSPTPNDSDAKPSEKPSAPPAKPSEQDPAEAELLAEHRGMTARQRNAASVYRNAHATPEQRELDSQRKKAMNELKAKAEKVDQSVNTEATEVPEPQYARESPPPVPNTNPALMDFGPRTARVTGKDTVTRAAQLDKVAADRKAAIRGE